MHTNKYTHLSAGRKLTVRQPLPVFPFPTQSVWAESSRESPSAIQSEAAKCFLEEMSELREEAGPSADPATRFRPCPEVKAQLTTARYKEKNKLAQHTHKHLCFVHWCVFFSIYTAELLPPSQSSLQVSRAPSWEGSAGRYSAGANKRVGVPGGRAHVSA